MFTVISASSLNDLQPSTGTGVHSNTTGAGAPKQAAAPGSQTDTVKLSVTQQVRNLHSEGEGPGQIASSLGLTSSQVNGDLYVSLTWPQLLSKVASSSLTLGSTVSDASVSVADATGSAAAATIFPASKSASATDVPASHDTKDAASPEPVIFPSSKDEPATAAAVYPVAKTDALAVPVSLDVIAA